MKVIELREELEKLPNNWEVVVAVYLPGDSGEQDHYEIDTLQEYPNHTVQIKTK